MKNSSASPPPAIPPVVSSPPATAEKDHEFFRRSADPDPSMPEIAAREAAAGGAPVVTEIAPVAVQPERVGPDGPRVEHREGGKFVAGTNIVVGGPTQQ